MKRFILHILLGSLFATLGEFLFCVLVRQDIDGYLFTLAAYPLIILLAWIPMRWIERRARTAMHADVSILLFAGLTGLAIEWFLIGNSPWQNPQAHDLGMFCYWAVVLAMPRLLLDERPHLRGVRCAAGMCFPVFAVFALALGFATPQAFRLFVLVWVVVLGYFGLSLFFARALLLEWRQARREAALVRQPAGA